jgi:CheY-like chemotaxis protein
MSIGNSVLVVDGEPLIRIEFADMLEKVGFLLATTAAAAISILSEHEKIRLIMMDMEICGRIHGGKACSSFLVVWSGDPCKTEFTN